MSSIQNQTIARPYAAAAYRFAKQQNAVTAWQDFLNTFSEVFSEKEIEKILANPFVEQIKVVQSVVELIEKQVHVSAEQINFLKLLAASHRLAYLATMTQQFKQHAEEDAGLMSVMVSSAFDLDAKTLEHLKQKLTTKFQKQISMATKIDTDLLGGVKLQVGDHVLDASVKGMLAQLNQSLSRS